MDRTRFWRIAGISLPVIGGMVSQNILNLVDTAMVGQLGTPALAAVGLGSFVTFMCQAVILGIATAVQAMAARRIGAGSKAVAALPLNAGLLGVILVSLPLSCILVLAVPFAYPWLNADPDVITAGVPYLQVRVAAIMFVGCNFAFRGFWNAVDLSKLYMGTLIVMHAINVVLNYALIFGNFGFPAMGVLGAGLGTSIATGIGTLIYIALGLRHAWPFGFLRGLPPWEDVRRLVRLTIPSGIQQFFFAAGFAALYWIIGRIGTVELAAANILINVMLVAILPGIALGISAASLVGQALGRHDTEDAYRWGWDVVRVAAVFMGVLGMPMWLMPDAIIGVFVDDPTTIATARGPMIIVGLTMPLEAVLMVLMNSLLGAGDSQRVMVISVVAQWVFFLPCAFILAEFFGATLLEVWLAQLVYRAGTSAVLTKMWMARAWARIEV